MVLAPSTMEKKKRAATSRIPPRRSAAAPPPDFESSASSERPSECSFCATERAALILEGLVRRPLCLKHYYTTRAVRMDPAKVRPAGDGSELRRQLPAIQELFAEAFTELRGEIAEEAARSHAAAAVDPLGMIHGGRRMPMMAKRKKRPTSPPREVREAKKAEGEGGFLREVALPERYVRQQIRQKEVGGGLQETAPDADADADARGEKGTTEADLRSRGGNPYKRRKPAKTSIWNSVLNSGRGMGQKAKAQGAMTAAKSDWESIEQAMKPSVTCGCGSAEVRSDGNVTGRNNDMAKGETWGNKDRSDVVTRYQCLRCGKAWNEED